MGGGTQVLDRMEGSAVRVQLSRMVVAASRLVSSWRALLRPSMLCLCCVKLLPCRGGVVLIGSHSTIQ